MTAFGLGELPGTNFVEAADIVFSETPLPHIPQLPERGLGSDLIGRTAALLPLHLDKGPRSWIVTRRPQIMTRRAADQFERDLDTLEELWAGKIEQLKVQLVGPWTLAAEIEMPNGHRMLSDRGALEDLTAALREAVENHVADVAKRFGADVVVQLDEPKLPQVLAGRVKGTTDYDTIAKVDPQKVYERLELFGDVLLHTTSPLFDSPWITVDLSSLTTTKLLDEAGAALGQGHRFAIAPMEPKKVGEIVDKLQIDPVVIKIDVYATGGRAEDYRRAREVDDILQRDFLS
ncbi:methionine synthase [Corynebacterium breve]|uniref:Methionine synthase n=1 Tax=Corynebacterium breve TaxID=3049799 RepID=A0ABY8VKA2_9CORY|nr:methionine synthase [Corynebacterium breve]WIM68658.1 methionine synthase [Corynebacterium breve]